jgi:hypothetical protein
MLLSIAEFKTTIRTERQADGINKDLGNGVKFGAKAKLADRQVTESSRWFFIETTGQQMDSIDK